MFKEGKITRDIIGIAMKVHSEIGPGFNERIYHKAMIIALKKAGFIIDSEIEFNVFFQKHNVGKFRLNIVVNKKIIVELKAVSGEIKRLAKYKNYNKSV